MKNKSFIFFAYLLFACVPAQAQQLDAGINHILAQITDPVMVSMKVQSMNDGHVLFEKHSNQAFTPASNFKLFTAVAALLYLGPDYKYATELSTDSPPHSSNLDGNLFLKFSGDVDLTASDLDAMFAVLHQQGVQKISGNLYLDDSAFDNKYYGKGWMWDDLNICYAGPVSALVVNRNCLEYNLLPAAQAGGKAQLQSLSNNNYEASFVKLENAVKTQAMADSCPLNLDVSTEHVIKLTGCISPQQSPLPLAIAVADPYWYARNLLQIVLAKNQLQLQGEIIKGPSPVSAHLIVTHYSRPLNALVKQMLKKSDNLIANTLLKSLGAKYFNQQGNWDNGVTALRAILMEKAHINLDKAVFVDGDGQSHYDLVTANQLAELLNFAYHDPHISQDFLASLPIAGVDGTLTNRMRNTNISVRAKTGSMAGVSSLSGFVESPNNQVWSFVILTNNHVGPDASVIQLEDRICKFLSSKMLSQG